MTNREKQRLRRIVSANASEYRRFRSEAALVIMRGSADETKLSSLRWNLTLAASYVAEAVATLEDHGDDTGRTT